MTALLLGFAPPQDPTAPNQPGGGFGFGPNAGRQAQPSFNDSRDKVSVDAFAAQEKVTPGGDAVIAVILDHQPGWHSWTNAGNVPKGMTTFEGAIRTSIKAANDAGAPIVVHESFIQWPQVHAATSDIGEGPKDYAVFSEQAVAFVPVTIGPDAAIGPVSVELALTFQSCNQNMCLAPTFDHKFTVNLDVVTPETLAASAQPAAGPMFDSFDGAVFARIHAGAQPDNPQPTPPVPSDDGAKAHAAQPTFFGFALPRTDGPLGVLLLALLAMVGGFILNLTPCVLPIIPIKILTISQHAAHGSARRTLVLGIWMAIGVVAFWAGIGIPAALFTAAADPSRIFGIWWLTLGIGLLIALMGVGIMGLFTIQLPAAAYAVNPKADTAWGSFLFGVMTGVLGLPCFGFVAGALLAGSATLPPATIMIIFTSMGVGMAAPYLVLAAKPSLVERIPRTGPASELVKQVMGLLLLAAAAYFIGSGLIALVIDYPYLAKQLHWWVVALCAVLAGAWLIVRTFQITSRVAPRAAFLIVGGVVAGVAVLYCIDSTAKARSIWMAQQASLAAAPGSYIGGQWNPYTPASFEKARADGKLVVLDFTAEWCLTCKALKATVLNREPVRSALADQEVVSFTVDLTSNSDPGWDFLRSLGKTGIPTLAIYSPGQGSPWTANAYTTDQVMEALASARENRVAAREAAPPPPSPIG